MSKYRQLMQVFARRLAPRRNLVASALLLGAGALLLYGCDTRLSEVPKEGTTVQVPSTRDSMVTARVAVPFAELQAAANAAAPSDFSATGRSPNRACVRIFWDICTDVDYSVSVHRAGAVAIGRGAAANTVRISVPIRFDGWAGFAGDVARVLKLDRKNFEGALTAVADLAFDIDANWCPQAQVAPSITWKTPPRVEIIGGVWIPVEDNVKGPLQNAMNQMAERVRASIPCDRLKNEAVKVWVQQSYPANLPGFGNVYINVDPQRAAFSGLAVSDDRIEFAAQLVAKVNIATAAATIKVKPLPTLTRIAVTDGALDLQVPFRASYTALSLAASKALVGKPFTADTKAGKVTAQIKNVKIYPTGNSLAIGVTFTANLPGRFLNVTGDVYLYGEPVVSADGKAVVVRNVRFARILDNDVWNGLSAVFDKQIRTQLEAASAVDLSPQIAQALAAISEGLNHAQSGVRIDLANPKLGLAKVVPGKDELVVEGKFSANGTVKFVAGA